MQGKENNWEWEYGPKPSRSIALFRSVYDYRHLLGALVRKEFLLNYQQTILGPLWIFFQPVLTLIIYVLVFGHLIGIQTGKSVPPVLFYFSGIILWNFFNDSFGGISNTFRDHIHLYSKVYFPRIIAPLSILSTNFIRFLIQLALMSIVLVYYIIFKHFHVGNGAMMLVLPVVFIGIAMISMGCGLIAAVLTARYRDLINLIGIVLRLLMFVTPVLYPLATVKDELKWVVLVNPLTPLFELFRLAVLGEGTIEIPSLVYCFLFALAIFIISLFVFNTRSSTLIDIS